MKFLKLQVEGGLACVSPKVLPGPEAAASCPSPGSGTRWPGSLAARGSKVVFFFFRVIDGWFIPNCGGLDSGKMSTLGASGEEGYFRPSAPSSV